MTLLDLYRQNVIRSRKISHFNLTSINVWRTTEKPKAHYFAAQSCRRARTPRDDISSGRNVCRMKEPSRTPSRTTAAAERCTATSAMFSRNRSTWSPSPRIADRTPDGRASCTCACSFSPTSGRKSRRTCAPGLCDSTAASSSCRRSNSSPPALGSWCRDKPGTSNRCLRKRANK